MSKPYTPQDLSDIFDEDIIWRRKELSDMKAAVKAADATARSSLLRAIVAMTYAHWEGYVRYCANRYFEFLTLRKRPFSDFHSQFYINSFIARLDSNKQQGRMNIEARCTLVSEILGGAGTRFTYINPDLVDTRSNLSTDVIKDICLICAVDGAHFEDNRVFLDRLLLKRRNAIAHGQQEPISESEIDDLVATALALMAHFRSLLENVVYTASYLAA